MPKGPRGEKRPADVIGAAIMVARISVGDIEDNPVSLTPAQEFARSGGLKGGVARAGALSPEQRREIARKAAAKRWGKKER